MGDVQAGEPVFTAVIAVAIPSPVESPWYTVHPLVVDVVVGVDEYPQSAAAASPPAKSEQVSSPTRHQAPCRAPALTA
jgi:hypothetical protein